MIGCRDDLALVMARAATHVCVTHTRTHIHVHACAYSCKHAKRVREFVLLQELCWPKKIKLMVSVFRVCVCNCTLRGCYLETLWPS